MGKHITAYCHCPFFGSANIDYILELLFVIKNFLIQDEIESGNRTKWNQESRLMTLRRKKTNKRKTFQYTLSHLGS